MSMENIQRYGILGSSDARKLANLVNKRIIEGWVPLGGIQVGGVVLRPDGAPAIQLYQSMVKVK
jgi:hypothetical protein